MACYRPIHGYYARKVNETGKRSLVFTLSDGYADRPVSVPCGKCIGCRLERARQWAVRCMHEAKLHERNMFVTLTYEDKQVPYINGRMTLEPRDFVLFMKKLRLMYGPGIRFFQCGEYGDVTGRPHHHALIFNHDFDDRKYHSISGESGEKLYVSSKLDKMWGHGYCYVGEVTFESAGYVARYTMKKIGSEYVDKSPVVDGPVREYLTMSRRPGIGYGWAVKNRKDYYPSDEVVVNGVATRPPRYYDGIQEKLGRSVLLRVKARRRKEAGESEFKRVSEGVTYFAKEVIKRSAISTFSRSAE